MAALQKKSSRTWFDDEPISIAITRNYKYCTTIYFKGSDEESSTESEAINALLAYRNVPDVCLCFETSFVSKAIEESINSLRFVSELSFNPGIAGIVLKLMQILVPKKTLNEIGFDDDYEFDDETASLFLDLLKQTQFYHATLPNNPKSNFMLDRIIAEWRENSEEFVGKLFWTGIFLPETYYQESEIRECSEEEKRYLNLYYPHTRLEKSNNLHILKNCNRGSIYWMKFNRGAILWFA